MPGTVAADMRVPLGIFSADDMAMFDVRAVDLRLLNSLTKYPSIPTYHTLDPRDGGLTDPATVFPGRRHRDGEGRRDQQPYRPAARRLLPHRLAGGAAVCEGRPHRQPGPRHRRAAQAGRRATAGRRRHPGVLPGAVRRQGRRRGEAVHPRPGALRLAAVRRGRPGRLARAAVLATRADLGVARVRRPAVGARGRARHPRRRGRAGAHPAAVAPARRRPAGRDRGRCTSC